MPAITSSTTAYPSASLLGKALNSAPFVRSVRATIRSMDVPWKPWT
jgi:hypothetical protein